MKPSSWQTKATIMEAIKDSTKLSEDKLRLFSLFYLSTEGISKEDLAEYEVALREAGCRTDTLNYLKQ